MAINYRALKKEWSMMENANAVDQMPGLLRQAFEAGDLKTSDFALREGYEELVPNGLDEIRAWRRGQELSSARESSAVRRELFMNINGVMVTSMVEMGFKQVQYIGDKLVTVNPSTMLDGERFGGTTDIGDTAEAIGEGQPYGSSTFGEDWVWTPEMTKRGTKVGLTKELIIGDKTGQMFKRARDVGKGLGYNKEIRILDMVLGLVSGVYKRKNKTAVDVYGDNSGDHDWDNLLASNGLVDWTDIEAASLLFEGLTDPNTGWLVDIEHAQILVPSALKIRARHILGATKTQFVDNTAGATTYRTESEGNGLDDYELLSSRYVSSRQGNSTTWYMGDFKGAFVYNEAWPITVVQAPAGHPADFDSDIIAQWKASEMGVVACVEPRKVAKFTA